MSEDVQQIESPESNAVAAAPVNRAVDKKKQSTAIVPLGNNIEIYPDGRLPEYDMGEVKAYQAMEKEGRGEKCFALICEPHLVPRLRAAVVFPSIINASLLSLVSHGVVYWPPAKQERCVLVYRDAPGKRALTDNAKPAMGWRQELVMNAVVPSMISVLSDFRNKDFVHGSIRPSNMYVKSSGGNVERIVLGDCLSTPASYTQPALYEPIVRAMSDPLARGPGTIADDIYSFGVSLAVFLRSNDPCEGMSNEDIIRRKMEVGSYSVITGKDRFKGSILELLRGLLQDDATQRWTIDEILTWLDGRRLSPKQSVPQKKAQRAISFLGEKYLLMPFLAMDLRKSPGEALKLIESNELQQWVTRSVDDDDAIDRVEKAVQSIWESGKGAGYEERLLCNISQALDPDAPVRYKGMSIMGDGVGVMLADAMVAKKDVKPYVELFLQGIVLNWVTGQRKLNIDTGSLISRFDSCRNYMRQTRIGFGIERCLYVLCPEAQCLSEKLRDYFVRGPDELIIAFEDMCAKGKSPAFFIDRHIAAFLSVKDSKCVDSFLYDLDAPEEYKRVMGNIKCLAAIQKRADIKSLPYIARALQAMMSTLYDRYHDREVREKIKKNIDKFVEEGSIIKMGGLLENMDVMGKDRAAFKAAMVEYRQLTDEAKRLEASLEHKDTFGRTTGKEVAAVVSSIISSVVIIFLTIMFLTR